MRPVIGTIHIVGAGIAGLACAVALASKGARIELHEAAPLAGGRCRSYHDRALGRVVDNGNHLLLSGNRAALGYLDVIGAGDGLSGSAGADFPFIDLETGERWRIGPMGRLPIWMLRPGCRVPRSRALDHLLGTLRLARAGQSKTVAQCTAANTWLYQAFWQPLAVAVLNTPPETASAALFWAALRESLAKGAAASRPLIASRNLSAAFVEPALDFLGRQGAKIRFGARLHRLDLDARAKRLFFADHQITLGDADQVVLAVPPLMLQRLLPQIEVPKASHAIVNAHFRLPGRSASPPMIVGMIGGTAHWLFLRDDIVSITVSAADDLLDAPSDVIALRLWQDAAQVIGCQHLVLPAWRVIKERRATIAQTPEAETKRPAATTRWPNLYLAGDWTATGLPATIEGAVRSAEHAAAAILKTDCRFRQATGAHPRG